MPRNLPVDKSILKAAFCKGIPLSDLAEKHKLNLGSLRSIAIRGKWSEAKAKTDELVQQVAQDAGLEHVAKIAAIASAKIDELSAYDFIGNVKNLDAEGFTRCLNTLDLMKRRAHKLDEQQAKTSSLVQVNVTTNGGETVASWHSEPVTVLGSDIDTPELEAQLVKELEDKPAG